MVAEPFHLYSGLVRCSLLIAVVIAERQACQNSRRHRRFCLCFWRPQGHRCGLLREAMEVPMSGAQFPGRWNLVTEMLYERRALCGSDEGYEEQHRPIQELSVAAVGTVGETGGQHTIVEYTHAVYTSSLLFKAFSSLNLAIFIFLR